MGVGEDTPVSVLDAASPAAREVKSDGIQKRLDELRPDWRASLQRADQVEVWSRFLHWLQGFPGGAAFVRRGVLYLFADGGACYLQTWASGDPAGTFRRTSIGFRTVKLLHVQPVRRRSMRAPIGRRRRLVCFTGAPIENPSGGLARAVQDGAPPGPQHGDHGAVASQFR
jgi:hypothetical protein